MTRRYQQSLKHASLVGLGIVGLIGAGVLVLNLSIILSAQNKLVNNEEALSFDADTLVVPGAAVSHDKPSGILEDRLKGACALYKAGAAPRIIVSGNKEPGYDEPSVMKEYLCEQGIPSEDIYCDYAGYTTYETMARARKVFGCSRIIVVTQKYHLYRSVYLADSLGMKSIGVPSDYRSYNNQLSYDIRELFARAKGFMSALLKPDPRVVEEPYDASINGNQIEDPKLRAQSSHSEKH